MTGKEAYERQIKDCMNHEYFLKLINKGDALGALAFATGYLNEIPVLHDLLLTIIESAGNKD